MTNGTIVEIDILADPLRLGGLELSGLAWRRSAVRGALRRFSDMGQERDRLVDYCSRLVGGLVVCGVAAATLHADVAALAILAAVMLAVLGLTTALLLDGDL